MKCSRKVFVNALNYCKRNKNNISNALLANSLKSKNYVQFWKEVKKRRGADRGTASVCIDGVKSPPKSLLISLVLCLASSTVHNYNLNVHPSNRIKFTERDVKDAIAQLKTGIGFDGVHSNHLKFASEYAVSILTMFLNSCLFHNYFPSNLLEGVINPILKNKLGDKCASSNYREVMIFSNIFKVMEYLVLPFLKSKIHMSRHQFGYIRNKSTVYSCFLDMSKAFERVNHSLLLKKLQSSNVNPCIIKLLENVFRNSTASVFYNNCFSKKWTIRRGCRQGGVLSAFLFSLYIDSILTEIGNFSFGCRLGSNKINIIAYADDIALC